jgi:cleavage and polyadenylation specificity factor subunit 4
MTGDGDGMGGGGGGGGGMGSGMGGGDSHSMVPSGHARPLSEVECFMCHERGHYANHCPLRRTGIRPSR